MNKIIAVPVLLIILWVSLSAQQVSDSAFVPPIGTPAYSEGQGPIVMIDAAHHNFHTADGRYFTFAQLLRRDGYQVISSGCSFSADSLRRGSLLVISNALNERNTTEWSLPTPSAFTPEEIAAVSAWVTEGGSLLLIADHMPFPGCADQLAASFGIAMNNGFAIGPDTLAGGTYVFRRGDNTLRDHPITQGRNESERIDSVRSFTGQAFQADSAYGLMVFGDSCSSLMPEVAWQFNDSTARIDVSGWYQGVVKAHGKGRIAVFGEAAMFSAQLAGPNRQPMGMNHPQAPQNVQFLLNVMHWLSGKL